MLILCLCYAVICELHDNNCGTMCLRICLRYDTRRMHKTKCNDESKYVRETLRLGYILECYG